MKRSSKGQIGMMEMIMVMVVIVILLVVGMVFYFRFSIARTEKAGEEIEAQKAAILASTIAQLPEIECTGYAGRGGACADTLKLFALSIKDEQEDKAHKIHYSNLFGYRTIRFEQIWPPTEEKECTDEVLLNPDYPETPPSGCKTWTVYHNPKKGMTIDDAFFRTMPVALYYPTNSIYTFGELQVYTY